MGILHTRDLFSTFSFVCVWVRNTCLCLHFQPFSVFHYYLIPQSSPCLMQYDMKSWLREGWDVFCIWTLRGLWDREQPPTAGSTDFLPFVWRKVSKGQLRPTVPCRFLLQRSSKIWNFYQKRENLFYITAIRRHRALRETACYETLWANRFFWGILILVPCALDFRQEKRKITQHFSPISSSWPVRISKNCVFLPLNYVSFHSSHSQALYLYFYNTKLNKPD